MDVVAGVRRPGPDDIDHPGGTLGAHAGGRRPAANLPPEPWQTTIGDPGAAVEELVDSSVYYRGAMTLQALRQTVGDEVFFDILETWVSSQAGGTVSTDEFIERAEMLTGLAA